jgi:hypothetical protein
MHLHFAPFTSAMAAVMGKKLQDRSVYYKQTVEYDVQSCLLGYTAV